MVYSDFGTDEVDIPDSDTNTALHIAMFVSKLIDIAQWCKSIYSKALSL